MNREEIISEYKKAYEERQKNLAKIDVLRQQLTVAEGEAEELRKWMAGLEIKFDRDFGKNSLKHCKNIRQSLGTYIRRGEEVPE